MSIVYCGVDVSKGYADIVFMNEAGSFLSGAASFDDTQRGHDAVLHTMQKLARRNVDVSFQVGVESSGGLERNWVKFFHEVSDCLKCKVYSLNPLVVKRFLSQDLHHGKTDVLSAKGIANYLQRGLRTTDHTDKNHSLEERELWRVIRNMIHQMADQTNELHSLLIQVQPELVAFSRSGFSRWILKVLRRYPTAAKLAKAKAETLSKIPYVALARAKTLIQNARESVGSFSGASTARAIQILAKGLLEKKNEIAMLQKDLLSNFCENLQHQILVSIPGVASWTAAGFLIELGEISRFPNASALIAFIGSDPVLEQSGDLILHRGISRHGCKHLRSLLFLAALTAIRCNPPIQRFYERLCSRGKPRKVALIACMNKLIRIMYACLVTEKKFDAEYEFKKFKVPAKEKKICETSSDSQIIPPTKIFSDALAQLSSTEAQALSVSLSAPISARKARKRRMEAISRSRSSLTMKNTLGNSPIPLRPVPKSSKKTIKKQEEKCL